MGSVCSKRPSVGEYARALATFRYLIIDLRQRTLRRLSQKDRMRWERITRLADDWLPKPRILHPLARRVAVRHPRCEPYA
jgi:RNA-directed DNA polymerase